MSHEDTIKTALDESGIVLLPTETVWGVAGRADDAKAVDAIYAAKGRDFDKPLAVCVEGLAQAEQLGMFDHTARQLARRYWPGPVTLIVPARATTALDKRCFARASERRTIAFRCPQSNWRKTLCTTPLALTSANPSGEADSVTRAEAMAALPGLPALDGEIDKSGKPSTIVAVLDGSMSILRQGAVIITGVAAG